MANSWKRTASRLDLYGYRGFALEGARAWEWAVYRENGNRPLARGETKRETAAKAAARRFILRQPDAAAEYAEDTRVHWNGRDFENDRHSTWSNGGSGDFHGACGSYRGESTNHEHRRARINCARCLDLLAQAERKAAP